MMTENLEYRCFQSVTVLLLDSGRAVRLGMECACQ
jgi:hypothetical protein